MGHPLRAETAWHFLPWISSDLRGKSSYNSKGNNCSCVEVVSGLSRVILHVDANSYYASVECLYTPSLRGKPMAVCGSVDDRHGIVLAKSEMAKKAGVKTGMAIWQARQACPGLLCVPPDYDLYMAFSQKLRMIYARYTDRVEAFGLDECWLDVSAPGKDRAEGEAIAHEIRERVKAEMGVTVSVGVSFNKVFAKLGSDYRKPDAVTVIPENGFEPIVWPLPVSDLLYVGPRTAAKLSRYGIATIGDLAGADTRLLEYKLGKNGVMLKAFALGRDVSPVRRADDDEIIKSVGNSTTPPHDIRTPEEAKAILYLLMESVGQRLRALGFKAKQVSVTARGTDLLSRSCQRRLHTATDSTARLAQEANTLFAERFRFGFPYRSMGVSCGQLCPWDTPVQLDLLGENELQRRQEQLDRALDSLHYRFGHTVIRRGVVLEDSDFARVNPAGQVIHPAAFLKEGSVKYDSP